MKRRDLLKSSVIATALLAIPSTIVASSISEEDVIMNEIRRTYSESLLFSEFDNVFKKTLELYRFIKNKNNFNIIVNAGLSPENECFIKVLLFNKNTHTGTTYGILFGDCPTDHEKLVKRFDLYGDEYVKSELMGNNISIGQQRYDMVIKGDLSKKESNLIIEKSISKINFKGPDKTVNLDEWTLDGWTRVS